MQYETQSLTAEVFIIFKDRNEGWLHNSFVDGRSFNSTQELEFESEL